MRGKARSDTPDDGGRSCERKTSLSDPGSLRERRATSPASGRGSGAGDVGARVAVAARAWLGTPYRHQASVKGVGADCLGLVRGLWREVVGAEPEGVPPYSPDWAEAGGREILLVADAGSGRGHAVGGRAAVSHVAGRGGQTLRRSERLRRAGIEDDSRLLGTGGGGELDGRLVATTAGRGVSVSGVRLTDLPPLAGEVSARRAKRDG